MNGGTMANIGCRCFQTAETTVNVGHVPGCPLYQAPERSLPPMQQGWQCPACGIGVAPWMTHCPKCADHPVPITTETTA